MGVGVWREENDSVVKRKRGPRTKFPEKAAGQAEKEIEWCIQSSPNEEDSSEKRSNKGHIEKEQNKVKQQQMSRPP